MNPASWTEPPVHPVAAIGDAFKVPCFADGCHPRNREADTNCGITSGNKLAKPTPAKPGRDRFGVGAVTDGTA
jgi:hypothetical protein